MKTYVLFVTIAVLPLLSACNNTIEGNTSQTEPMEKDLKVATFAGGCFWCIESGFEKLEGVKEAISGYTGGDSENPTYKDVSSGKTEHVEAVQIYYDPNLISYKQLLESLWKQTDPTDNGGQFADRGKHYRTGIFYHDEKQKMIAGESKAALGKSGRYNKSVVTELHRFKQFWPAAEYHQDYYKKNPIRYKFYRYRSGRDQFLEETWGDELNGKPGKMGSVVFNKPGDDYLRGKLTALQYEVTQEEGTEPPFKNAYWNETREGIYVDVETNKPPWLSSTLRRAVAAAPLLSVG